MFNFVVIQNYLESDYITQIKNVISTDENFVIYLFFYPHCKLYHNLDIFWKL